MHRGCCIEIDVAREGEACRAGKLRKHPAASSRAEALAPPRDIQTGHRRHNATASIVPRSAHRNSIATSQKNPEGGGCHRTGESG